MQFIKEYNVSLILDYPWYFLLFCLLLGVAYSVVLYFLRRRKSDDEPLRGRWWLAALRTLSVAAIAFLFLAPLVKKDVNTKEKPIIIIAEDNSKSLDYSPDSAYYHDGFQSNMDALIAELSKDYDVHRYSYGSKLSQERPQLFSEQTTDMAQMLSELSERYFHRNVGAMILTGDGIYNSGFSPLNNLESLTYPVYTVAMGDTTVHRDASISNVRSNRIAYLGNSFPMDITVGATRLKGESSTLTVSCDGKRLYSKQITFNDANVSTTESIVLEAEKAGLHNYIVEIAPLSDEHTVRNNRRIVPIEVIDGHQKIAIISAVPHPDVAALRRAVERNGNYEVETFLARDFNKNAKDYDLLILHQLPSKVADAGMDVAALLKSGTPAVFVLGAQTDLARLNALHAGLEVYSRIDRQNEVSPMFNNSFTFFTMDEDAASRIERFPPLLSPFGEYKLDGNAQILFSAKLGSVNSGLPLVAMTRQQEHRYSFIAGEGLWRWRLADYQANQTNTDFDDLIDKIVVFTALRVDKNRFHVNVKNIFSETESVVFEAQLYNDNYEPVNTPDVDISIQQKGEQAKRYIFNRSASGYSLNIGTLAAGSYSYTASTQFNGKTYTASGNFIVENLQLESLNLVADHSLLATVAATTGGVMVDAHQLDRLPELLSRRDDIKTVIYSETRYINMLNLPWVFILIVLLLTVEWVVRKYNGEI